MVRTFSVSELKKVVEHRVFPAAWQERAKVALCELNTREVSTKPMFVYAMISRADEPGEYLLTFMCFDEARDLRGLRIKERQENAGEAIGSITEDYPIFVDYLESWTLERRVIPVTIRQAGQRKDEGLWLEYENRCLRAVVERVLASKHKRSVTTTPRDRVSIRGMPPLCMSLPEPNHVTVQICAYDKTGRESTWINVDYWPYND
ncbi:MAG: hypothetical protein JW993_20750 [Sedimentisphaerales bacterium]|nr:hypothetical protein [Sedimentisphaerales bacterium]